MTRNRILGTAFAALSAACLNLSAQDGTVIQQTEGGTVTMKPVKPKVDVDELFSGIPDVVAKVGDQEIKKAELVAMLKPQIMMQAQFGRKLEKADVEPLAKEFVDDMVKMYLVRSIAQREGYSATADIGDKEYKKYSDEFAQSQPDDRPKQSFDDMLKEQNLDPAEVKKQMADGACIQKWIEEKIKPSIKIDDEEALKYYNENKGEFKTEEKARAAHILIKPETNKELDKKIGDASRDLGELRRKAASAAGDEKAALDEQIKKLDADLAALKAERKAFADNAKPEAKKKAERLLQEIKDGADFGALAEKESGCPSGKASKGDLGIFGKGSMVPPFEEAVWKLKDNEISDVVETTFGYHIIKKISQTPEGYTPFDEIKDKIKSRLANKKLAEVMEAKVAEEAKVVKTQNFISGGSSAGVAPAPAN